MLIGGIIVAIVGVVSLIFGIVQNNSLEAQLTSLFKNGSGNPGTIWIIIGIVLVVVGLIVLFLGLRKKGRNKGAPGGM